jgi:predicted nucleic acid-binding protein
MTGQKVLVLDANILIRAVLGQRVRHLIKQYQDRVDFYVPDLCLVEARRHLPGILSDRGVQVEPGVAMLEEISSLMEPVSPGLYARFKIPALQRVSSRDPKDWPIVATALLLRCPIWTEDRDFFGIGIPTWVTELVEIFLDDPQPEPALPAYPVT